MGENQPNCGSQNGKAKSQIVAEIARIVRKHGLDYDGWRYISKRVRQKCELRPAKRAKKLPRVLTADDFRRFYRVVDQADDVQHSLMLRLLFYTGGPGFRVVPDRSGRRGPGELQDFRESGQGVEGSLRLVRQVLRHRSPHSHRGPPQQPMAVPDPTQYEILNPPGGADRQTVCRAGGGEDNATHASAPVRSPG